jgi:hypothetical protein
MTDAELWECAIGVVDAFGSGAGIFVLQQMDTMPPCQNPHFTAWIELYERVCQLRDVPTERSRLH